MIEIEVDEEVFEFLKARAEPFLDTPNTVMRRVLGLEEDRLDDPAKPPAPIEVARGRRARRGKGKSKSAGTRAPAGSLLPESEYVEPILQVIAANGGRAPAREVIEAVGAIISDRLTPLDKEKMRSGGVRWHNRVQFTRLRMLDQGLLKRGSPRGLWEISDEGARFISPKSAA
ncbi:MAG: hypothetical protein M3P18_11865 [Actinomycetota bacterium]|nr:hypothetical protein [Actinomycetota bacterium]